MRQKYQLPELEAMGLYPVQTTGSGNCLFHALSDQLHGDQSKHAEYRAETVAYMRAHPSQFKDFLPFHPGGGNRRNPKRKVASASTRPVATGPTDEEVEAAFQLYLKSMAQERTYGDNLAIVAFAKAYKVNVYVWSEEMKIFVHHQCEDSSVGVVKKLYILHHTWEHFASLRNVSGPHTGPAKVTCSHASLEDEAPVEGDVAQSSHAKAWMIDSIQGALPYKATREAIAEALDAYEGNMTKAVSALMPASSSSSSRTSSIERDMGPEEEIDIKPTKKPYRRSSRPQPLQFRKSNKNFSGASDLSNQSSPDPAQLSAALSKLTGDDVEDPDKTDEEDWHKDSQSQASGTTSVNTSASNSSAASKGSANVKFPRRLKLTQPKKPSEVKHTPLRHSEPSPTGSYDGDEEKPPRVIAKPRRRLITGAERERQRREKARKASQRSSLSPTSANSKASNKVAPVTEYGVKELSLRLSPTGLSSEDIIAA
ncbi:hypothetical protein ACLMJK_003515 [Lecanora helva]